MEDESPWVGPSPQSFCKVFSPMDFFDGAFFQCGLFWPSPTWAKAKPCGLGQINTYILDHFQIFNYVLEMVFVKFYSSY